MNKRQVILLSEEWDRLIEILDSRQNQHPDAAYLLTKLHNQLNLDATDHSHPLPLSPTFSKTTNENTSSNH